MVVCHSSLPHLLEAFDLLLEKGHSSCAPGSGFGTGAGEGFVRFSAFGLRNQIEKRSCTPIGNMLNKIETYMHLKDLANSNSSAALPPVLARIYRQELKGSAMTALSSPLEKTIRYWSPQIF